MTARLAALGPLLGQAEKREPVPLGARDLFGDRAQRWKTPAVVLKTGTEHFDDDLFDVSGRRFISPLTERILHWLHAQCPR